MSLTPDLDALRLELAAACFDSVTKQFAHFAKFGRAEGITDDDRARFRIAADAPFLNQPECVGSPVLERARARLGEGRDTLSHGDSQTLHAATQTAALQHTWCGG